MRCTRRCRCRSWRLRSSVFFEDWRSGSVQRGCCCTYEAGADRSHSQCRRRRGPRRRRQRSRTGRLRSTIFQMEWQRELLLHLRSLRRSLTLTLRNGTQLCTNSRPHGCGAHPPSPSTSAAQAWSDGACAEASWGATMSARASVLNMAPEGAGGSCCRAVVRAVLAAATAATTGPPHRQLVFG